MESVNSGSLSGGIGVGDDGFDFITPFFRSSSISDVANGTYSPPQLLSSSTSDGRHQLLSYPSGLSYLDSFAQLQPLDSAAAAPPWPRPLLIHPSSDCTTAAVGGGGGSRSRTVATLTPRSSKKRSRASRRVPTTVLTTDTSNFRAMVQEFTGIPSPPSPFAAAPSCSSRFTCAWFDRFQCSPSAAPPPSFLLRSFPQKVQSPSATDPVANYPFPHLRSVIDSTSGSATENNCYPPPSLGRPALGGQLMSQHLLSPESCPPLNFRTLLQANSAAPTETTTGSNAGFPLAEHDASELDGIPPELMIGPQTMRRRSTAWMSDSVILADSAQWRHVEPESIRKQKHSASGARGAPLRS